MRDKKKEKKRVLQTDKQVKKTRTEEDSTIVANIKTMTAGNDNLVDSEKCRDMHSRTKLPECLTVPTEYERTEVMCPWNNHAPTQRDSGRKLQVQYWYQAVAVKL